MSNFYLLFIFILFSSSPPLNFKVKTFPSQNHQISLELQNIKVYKANKVKLRRDNTYINDNRTVLFNKDGKIEKVLNETHSLGKEKILHKRYYYYDSQGLMTRSTDSSFTQYLDCSYSYFDNSSFTCNCKDNNSGVRTIVTLFDGKRKTTHWLTDKDTTVSYLQEFDNFGNETSFYGTYFLTIDSPITVNIEDTGIALDKTNKNWKHTYVLVYDGNQLVSKTTYINGERKKTENYIYNKKGLLTSINSTDGEKKIFSYE